ncbi:MAG: hypothetical protein A4E52_01360 [Pelotomaculum sp. PtaB.Bin013]|uniref:Metal-dependent hydrolase n=1 Tax=Pelotomaculum isophthalicicum JI TaxID=947010 RepID=A0A9X4H0S9_9FIRM|nr:metal-dependent hydrolase [Pelotomaculum isophthalicicum]MDF9407006.1 metal-dependent hydrolase [Pelotomaculum isophthalicicum JI]OPX87536.1 MAG: hypothetical protein A4E52_01360 [Pelotomaculum sp. PtaB.Bin013]
MILFGHLGITLGATKLLNKMKINRDFTSLLDYRLVLVGSILPDLIDKPVGRVIFKEAINNGRIYAHTTIFLLLILVFGMNLWRKYKKPEILALALGVFFHDVLDSMWLYADTFFWPFYGWNFPRSEQEKYFWMVIQKLLTDPYTYMPELIGFVIIMIVLIRLIVRNKVGDFWRTGKLD